MVQYCIFNNKWRYLSCWAFISMVLILLPCCIRRTHLNDLENRDGIMVKKGEGVFTGKACSSDGKTVCVEFEMGRPKSMSFFYENGQMAGKETFKEDNIFDQDVTFEYYDKRGNPVTSEEFSDSEEGKNILQKSIIFLKEADN